MSDYGEHGEEEAPAAPFVHPGVQGRVVELCQRGDRSVGQVTRDFDLTETATPAEFEEQDKIKKAARR